MSGNQIVGLCVVFLLISLISGIVIELAMTRLAKLKETKHPEITVASIEHALKCLQEHNPEQYNRFAQATVAAFGRKRQKVDSN